MSATSQTARIAARRTLMINTNRTTIRLRAHIAALREGFDRYSYDPENALAEAPSAGR
jgi:hypothetical protein